MPLPNAGLDAVPFTILTAEFLDDMIENIEALADGSGLDDGAVDTLQIADDAVTPDKRSGGFKIIKIPTATLSTTGNKDITGAGFQPKSAKFTALVTDSDSALTFSIGGTDGTSQWAVAANGSESGGSMARVSRETHCMITIPATGGGLSFAAQFVSFDVDGITINVTTAVSAFEWICELQA